MEECYRCGHWDSDYGCCTLSSTNRWYACHIEHTKPENRKALEEYIKWYESNIKTEKKTDFEEYKLFEPK